MQSDVRVQLDVDTRARAVRFATSRSRRPTFLRTPARPTVGADGSRRALPRGGSRGLPEAEGSSTALQRSGILSAMKHMLNLYLVGVVLTLLSILVRLMESLGGLLENPSPGSSWTTRGQLANTEPPRAFQNIHPEGCDKTSLHQL